MSKNAITNKVTKLSKLEEELERIRNKIKQQNESIVKPIKGKMVGTFEEILVTWLEENMEQADTAVLDKTELKEIFTRILPELFSGTGEGLEEDEENESNENGEEEKLPESIPGDIATDMREMLE